MRWDVAGRSSAQDLAKSQVRFQSPIPPFVDPMRIMKWAGKLFVAQVLGGTWPTWHKNVARSSSQDISFWKKAASFTLLLQIQLKRNSMKQLSLVVGAISVPGTPVLLFVVLPES